MRVSVGIKSDLGKALIASNRGSIVRINCTKSKLTTRTYRRTTKMRMINPFYLALIQVDCQRRHK